MASLLSALIPQPIARDYHEREVRADARRAFAAVRALDFTDLALVRAIFALRPVLMRGRAGRPLPRGPFVDTARAMGWHLLHDGPETVVAVAVTRPWDVDVRFRGLPESAFLAFGEPGYVKIAWVIGVRPATADTAIVFTETSVAATDAESRKRFGRYWLVFGLGIRLIRRLALRHVARQLGRE
jgi:hypothetical protein